MMPRFNLNLKHKGIILVAVPLVFEIVFIVILSLLLAESERQVHREMHSKTIIYESGTLARSIHDAGIAMAGYGLTRSPLFKDKFDKLTEEIPEQFVRMKELIGENRDQQGTLRRLEVLTNKGLQLLLDAAHKVEQGGSGLTPVRSMYSELKVVTKQMNREMDALLAESRQIEAQGTSEQMRTKFMIKSWLAVAVAFNVFLSLMLAYFFAASIVKRLRVLTENSTRLVEGKPLAPKLVGTDEIAHLDHVFHDMAEALTQASRKERAVTEALRVSEARTRTVIENMLVGLVILTPDGTIETINPRIAQMFDANDENLVGKHVMQLFPELDRKDDPQQFLETLIQKSRGRIAELEVQKLSGEPFPVEMSLTEFEATEGKRFLLNILDVSERREVERLKREFVSTVSHELRTPLTSIRGSLTLLNVGALGQMNEQAQKVIDIAERNTIRLIGLINDILDIEKLQSGKLDMAFDNVELKGVLEKSVESVRAFAEQNAVQVECPPTVARIWADGDRIVQVVVNLLSNAIKFSEKNQQVRIEVVDEDKWVTVKVIDNGRGIPAKYKDLIFERFQQVEVSDAKRKGGTGLGLPICKGIIEQHHGDIGVESEEGKGSTFWFRLPKSPKGELVHA